MRIPRKLALIIVIMATPILFTGSLYYAKAREEIDRANLELDAVRYLRPLRTLFEHVPQHRGLARRSMSCHPPE